MTQLLATAIAAMREQLKHMGMSGSGMGLFKSRSQPLVRHVGVDLRGGQRSVPEHLLHAAKVRAALEQMGGHRVPKSVRAEVGCPLG